MDLIELIKEVESMSKSEVALYLSSEDYVKMNAQQKEFLSKYKIVILENRSKTMDFHISNNILIIPNDKKDVKIIVN